MQISLALSPTNPLITGGGSLFVDDLGRPMHIFMDDLGLVNFTDDLNRRI